MNRRTPKIEKFLGIGNGVGKQGRGNQPPIDDTDPIRKFSIDPGAIQTGKNKQNFFQKGSRYGISVSTPHRRYGHRLRTPFLRTPISETPKVAVQIHIPKISSNIKPSISSEASEFDGSIPLNSPNSHDPEGPARQIDVSRQKWSPHCLEAIFDSQLPSPKLSPKMPLPNCLSPTREGFLSSFKINPAVRVIARQVRGKNCLAAIFAPRHQSVLFWPTGLEFLQILLECSRNSPKFPEIAPAIP